MGKLPENKKQQQQPRIKTEKTEMIRQGCNLLIYKKSTSTFISKKL